jgi:protein-tyrosine phosphatase
MWFRKKNKKAYFTDFSTLGVDIHSHLIPAIDDGSANLDDSLAMLQKFVDLGYRKVITTPHVMSDYFRNDTPGIHAGLNALKRAAKENAIDLEIEAAAEYYIDFDFVSRIEKKVPLLTFGKNYLLVEISFLNPPERLANILFELQTERYKPVLAHPERYSFWFDNFSIYEELYNRGILFQLNMNSLTGVYGGDIQKMANTLIDKGMYSFAGSDCHRIQNLELMQKVLTNKHFERLLSSGKLLNNTL